MKSLIMLLVETVILIHVSTKQMAILVIFF